MVGYALWMDSSFLHSVVLDTVVMLVILVILENYSKVNNNIAHQLSSNIYYAC